MAKKKPTKGSAPAVDPAARDSQVRAASRVFHAAIPTAAASTGHWLAEGKTPGSRFDAVPDGAYRVHGADWILTFKGGHLVEANRAAPPHFGGPDIIAVPNG